MRTALIPEEATEFEREWRAVMARAVETLDLSEVLELAPWEGRPYRVARSDQK